jgi:tagatose 6-phosphate kinase
VILTVTLNAALDITYRVPRLTAQAANRVSEVVERPGGKGLGVARVLAALGHRTTATGFAGGATGRALREQLADSAGVEDALVPIDGTTRRTISVVDAATGEVTRLNEPGPMVGPAEWSAFLDVYHQLLSGGCTAVALCGSLPPGLPVGSYADLVREARATGVPVLLDTGGDPLRRGVAARPDLVRPDGEELAGLTGSTEPLRAAHDTRRRGARAVAVSLGAEGMLAVTPEGDWHAVPPRRAAGNATGAGDPAVAGLLSGLAENLPWPDRLARAVALSAATAMVPAAGEFDRRTYEELLPQIVVTEHPAAG